MALNKKSDFSIDLMETNKQSTINKVKQTKTAQVLSWAVWML